MDDEIALMRVRLKRAVEERPEDVQLLVKGLGMLVREVAEVKGRINGLIFVVAGAVITQVVLRLVQ